jgi:hypothetical protein
LHLCGTSWQALQKCFPILSLRHHASVIFKQGYNKARGLKPTTKNPQNMLVCIIISHRLLVLNTFCFSYHCNLDVYFHYFKC